MLASNSIYIVGPHQFFKLFTVHKCDLVECLHPSLTQIPEEKIIWEAPQKAQQVWFIKLYGANVNLGNIAPSEIIPLETLRLGLRGDSFDFFRNQ